MIETLISSKTRIKLLLKFFLNSNTEGYLRGLEAEFGESSNAIRIELNRFEKAGMLKSALKGNKKIFSANTQHPLYSEIHNILLKYIGFDKILDNVVSRLGNVEKVYVSGDFAEGKDSSIIDLIFVGKVDKIYLMQLVEKVEKLIMRKIRYIIYEEGKAVREELNNLKTKKILLWEQE